MRWRLACALKRANSWVVQGMAIDAVCRCRIGRESGLCVIALMFVDYSGQSKVILTDCISSLVGQMIVGVVGDVCRSQKACTSSSDPKTISQDLVFSFMQR